MMTGPELRRYERRLLEAICQRPYCIGRDLHLQRLSILRRLRWHDGDLDAVARAMGMEPGELWGVIRIIGLEPAATRALGGEW